MGAANNERKINVSKSSTAEIIIENTGSSSKIQQPAAEVAVAA